MFPMAHVWLLEQVVARPEPAHYVGCVWPDMLFGSPLEHAASHRRGVELLAFARQRLADGTPGAAGFMSFAAGVVTHCSEPHGFDWYSDEQWGDDPTSRGYAFQRGAPIAIATAAACGLPASFGVWKAHNVIEMAFELTLYAADPGLADRFNLACADADLRARLTDGLAAFYGHPASALDESMRVFADWWVRPISPNALAHIYARQVRAKHGARTPDEAAIAALIERAGALIAGDRESYLATCVTRVGELLTTLDAH
jgi:hypothetical protein